MSNLTLNLNKLLNFDYMKSFFSILFLGLLFAIDNECGTQSYLGPLAIQDIIDRNAQYLIRTEDTNTLYIKALLTSRDQTVSPRIEKINIRVI